MWDELKDRYESDSFFRSQIQLAVIVGAISLAYTLVELLAQRGMVPDVS